MTLCTHINFHAHFSPVYHQASNIQISYNVCKKSQFALPMVRLSVLKGVAPTKIFQQFSIDREKISFEDAMRIVPSHEIGTVMRRAHATGELVPQSIERALVRMLDKKLFRRAKTMLNFYQNELHCKLSPTHAQMMLNLAAQAGQWAYAIGLWQSLQSSCSTHFSPKSYATVLKAFRQSGDWRESLNIIGEMQRNGVSRTAAVRHAALHALRLNGPWYKALSLVSLLCNVAVTSQMKPCTALDAVHNDFAHLLNYGKIGAEHSSAAIADEGSETNAPVRTEALYIIKRAMTEARPTCWHVRSLHRRAGRLALTMYLQCPRSARTTALQNACLRVMAVSGAWQQAMRFVSDNIRSSTEASSHRVFTPETFAALEKCLRTRPDVMRAVLRVAIELDIVLPVCFVESLFRASVGTNDRLTNDGTHTLMALFGQLLAISRDEKTSSIRYHTLCEAMCDALIKVTDAATAARVGFALQATLRPAVPVLTENIASYGSELTIEMVEGRVAVIDGTISLEAAWLFDFFDMVVLPYAVVRECVYVAHTLKNKIEHDAHTVGKAHKFIKTVQRSDFHERILPLSFASQLRSNMHLAKYICGLGGRDDTLSAENTSLRKSLASTHRASRTSALMPMPLRGNEKDSSDKALIMNIFASAKHLQAMNFQSDVCVITQSTVNASAFEELCSRVIGSSEKGAKIPRVARLKDVHEATHFFQKDFGPHRYRERNEKRWEDLKHPAFMQSLVMNV